MNVGLPALLWTQSAAAHGSDRMSAGAIGAASATEPDAFVKVGMEPQANGAWSADIASATCIVVAIVVCVALYAMGVARLWRAASWGRGVRTHHVVAFVTGCMFIAIALLGPLDASSERSFAAHMLQHEILMLIAAPLLVVGQPLAAWAWMLPPAGQDVMRRLLGSVKWRATWRTFTSPGFSTALQLAAVLLWHVPRFFDAAAKHAGLHVVQHASFLATALCFWWAMRLRRSTHADESYAQSALAIACLFVTMLATGALGALLTFATTAWFSTYAVLRAPGLASTLEDQQLGGLLMWVPGGVVYMGYALLHAARLLTRSPSEVIVAKPGASYIGDTIGSALPSTAISGHARSLRSASI